MPNIVQLRTYFMFVFCTLDGDKFVLLPIMNRSITVLVA